MFTFKNKTKVLKAFLALLVATQYQLSSPMLSRFLNYFTQEKVDLHDSVINGDLDSVKEAINQGADVNKANDNGYTLLIIAAHEVHLEIVKYLCENKANVNTAANNGTTPLMYAAQSGHLETVKYLCENKANVNAAASNGATPLYVAALNGHLEIVKYLCEKGAEVNKAKKDGTTPLIIAAHEGYLEVVKYLCENKADVNQADDYGNTPLMYAAREGRLEVVKYLLYMILQEARSNAVTNKLSKKFILKNINLITKENVIIHWQPQIIACKKSSALHVACLLKNKEIIKKMLLFKPDLSAQDENGKKAIDYLQENDVALINLMSHPNCHRPTNEEDNEYYNRTVLMGANNQTDDQKAFVHNPVKYKDLKCFDLSLNYLNKN